MTIRREDLVAAASVGLLQYREIDPLLVFLLQRDVRAKRLELAAQAYPARRHWRQGPLSYILAFLALLAAAMFGVLFAMRGVHQVDAGALILAAVLYAAGAGGVAAWIKERGYCARVRILMGMVMASLPLAVLALQRAGG